MYYKKHLLKAEKKQKILDEMENDLRFHWQIARFSLDMEAIAGGRDKKTTKQTMIVYLETFCKTCVFKRQKKMETKQAINL